MVVDQAEIDTLLENAREGPPAEEQAAAAGPVATGEPSSIDPQAERLMKIRVPVIVELMRRPMPVSAIRKFSLGTILEFEKRVDEPLSLLINNRPVATGEAVRVDEKFGLRVLSIHDAAQRIRSMGAQGE
jgi:flagellar motor switch protein FliN/FliY